MRTRTRKTFAAPFVIVIATACGSKAPARPPYANPGPPQDPKPEQTVENQCEGIKEGDPCEAGKECVITKEDECGLTGYRCEDGKWDALMTYCNPPPPSN